MRFIILNSKDKGSIYLTLCLCLTALHWKTFSFVFVSYDKKMLMQKEWWFISYVRPNESPLFTECCSCEGPLGGSLFNCFEQVGKLAHRTQAWLFTFSLCFLEAWSSSEMIILLRDALLYKIRDGDVVSVGDIWSICLICPLVLHWQSWPLCRISLMLGLSS